MRRLRLTRLLPLGCFLLGWAAIYGVTQLPTGRAVDAVIVDMQVQQSSRVELFWNTFAEHPIWSTITGGARSTIEFHPPTSNLYVIRIDPSQRAEDTIIIYRVALRLNDGAIIEIPLGDIATWSFHNTTKPTILNGRLSFRSTTTDPYLYGPTNIPPSSWLERFAASAQKQARNNELIVQFVILGAVAAALIDLTLINAILLGLAILVPFLILYATPAIFLRIVGPNFHDVGTAIGPAAFNGLSVAPSRWATMFAAVAAMALAFVVWRRVYSNSKNTLVYTGTVRPVAKPCRPWDAMIAASSLFALMLMLVPDLKEIAQTQLTSAFHHHWDSHNITTWAGFIAQGKRPYTDFWYPYFGFWIFDLPLPNGALFRYAYNLALYWTLAMAIWRLVDRRLLAWLAMTVLLVLLMKGGAIPAPERYMLGVAVAVSYAAIDLSAPSGHSGRPWFWVACALALWGEPVQFIYALPALVIVFLHREFWTNRFQLRRVLARAGGDAAVPFVLLICFLGFLAYRGELSGFIETNRLTADSAIYAMLPTNLADEFPSLLSITSIGVVAPFLLLSIGMVGLLKSLTSAEQRLGLAVTCCGIVGVMVLQKHLIRPLGAQLLGPSIVGALLVFPLMLWRYRARALIATISGAITAAVLLNPTLSSVARDAVFGAPGRLESDRQVLANEPALFDSVKTAAFSRSRMANYQSELAAIDKLREQGNQSWFVLTDMPIFYLFSQGRVPFQINHYNTSPVRAQVDVRSWLSTTKPDAVILDPAALSFDGIQLVVREPLVANEVILNYVLFDRTGLYHLLTRRKDGQPINLAYWREILGHTVAYGHALGYTRAPQMPDCGMAANSSCIRYLELTFDTEATAPQPFDLPIMIGPFEFHVSFFRDRGAKRQYIPVDRIWFWAAGEALGYTPNPLLPAEVSARIVGKMPGGDILY